MSASEAHGEDTEMLAKWREVREQIAADEADAAAKLLVLHSEQAGLRADRERLAAVKQEIKDAGEQVSALEQRARSAVGASAELERELRVAAKDALRLQASLPGLEGEAREAEGQLEAFRHKISAELGKVRQHLAAVAKLRQDKEQQQNGEEEQEEQEGGDEEGASDAAADEGKSNAAAA